MTPGSARNGNSGSENVTQAPARTPSRHADIAALARDLVDKVGIDGAIRYCRSLGWRGVLDQVEMLRSPPRHAD
jgi:hypothetical protein